MGYENLFSLWVKLIFWAQWLIFVPFLNINSVHFDAFLRKQDFLSYVILACQFLFICTGKQDKKRKNITLWSHSKKVKLFPYSSSAI